MKRSLFLSSIGLVCFIASSSIVVATEQAPLSELPAEVQLSTLTHIPLSESEVRAKVEYTQLIFKMNPAKRILASGHEQAMALLEQSRNKAAGAQQALANGALEEADELANQCYRSLSIASLLVPSPHQLSQAASLYPEAINGLQHAKELHSDTFKRVTDATQRVEYEYNIVSNLEVQAADEAEKENHSEANQHLKQARMLVDLATMAMLDKQTVTYSLDLSTPKNEYEYELGRFRSYEELIPVAIEMKRPNKMMLMLVNRKVDDGIWKAEQAELTAKVGDYPKAIRMVMDASVAIRKGLKLMKVKLYE